MVWKRKCWKLSRIYVSRYFFPAFIYNLVVFSFSKINNVYKLISFDLSPILTSQWNELEFPVSNERTLSKLRCIPIWKTYLKKIMIPNCRDSRSTLLSLLSHAFLTAFSVWIRLFFPGESNWLWFPRDIDRCPVSGLAPVNFLLCLRWLIVRPYFAHSSYCCI